MFSIKQLLITISNFNISNFNSSHYKEFITQPSKRTILSAIPEHCHRVQTMEQLVVLNFWALQSIPSQINEQGKAFCTPAHKIFNGIIVSMDQLTKEARNARYLMALSSQVTLGFVI